MTFRSLATNLFGQQSYTRGWAWLTLINLISRGVGFLLFVMMPRVFQVGAATDLFFFFTNLSMKCSNFLGSINRSVLIPYAINLRESGEGYVGAYIYRQIASIYVVIFFLITFGIAAFPNTAMSVISRFESSVIANNHALIIALSVLAFLEVVSLVLSDWLFSMRYFTLPATLGLIGFILYLTSVLATQGAIGISGLVLCMVVFKSIQIGILAILTSKSFCFTKGAIPRELKVKVLAVYGSSAFSLVFEALPLLFLSSYSSGSITSLAYAQLLALIPYLLLVDQSEQIVGVHFAELGATQDIEATNHSFRASLERLMVFLIPLCCLLWLIGDQVLSLIFGGLADRRVLEQSGQLFAYLIWLPPLLAIHGFTAKVLFGRHHVLASSVYQIGLSLVGTAIIYIFINLQGLAGYGLGMCLLYILDVGTLGFMCALVMPQFSYLKGLFGALRNGAILGCSATVFAIFLAREIQASSFLGQFVTIVLSFVAGYSVVFSLLIGASPEKLGRFIALSTPRGEGKS